jgi:hypothetical protein
VRLVVIPLLIVVGLLVIALVLPTRHDKSVALWWRRVLYQANFFARVALTVTCLAAIVWYVLLPLMGWRSIGP